METQLGTWSKLKMKLIYKCITGNPNPMSLLNAGGKPEYPETNLRKRAWTANQMHIKWRARDSNPRPHWCTAREIRLRQLAPSFETVIYLHFHLLGYKIHNCLLFERISGQLLPTPIKYGSTKGIILFMCSA